MNVIVGRTVVDVFRCPSGEGTVPDDGGFPLAVLDYAFSKGPRAALCLDGVGGGMFDVNSRVRAAEVTDGLSNTFAMGEAVSGARLTAQSP